MNGKVSQGPILGPTPGLLRYPLTKSTSGLGTGNGHEIPSMVCGRGAQAEIRYDGIFYLKIWLPVRVSLPLGKWYCII